MNLIYADTTDIDMDDSDSFLFNEDTRKLIYSFNGYDGEKLDERLLETLGHRITKIDLSEVLTKKQIKDAQKSYDVSGIPEIVENYLAKKNRK